MQRAADFSPRGFLATSVLPDRYYSLPKNPAHASALSHHGSRDHPSRARKEAVARHAAKPLHPRSLTVAARFGSPIVSCATDH